MKIIDVQQGTPEWHEHRRCKVTGTKLKRIMGTLESRTGLIAELIAEEATEQTKQVRLTAQMERGSDEEEFAVKTFEERTGKKVDRVGICISDSYDWLALSPDGLIADAEGKYSEAIEVKCPDTQQAFLYKLQNLMPLERLGLLSKKGEPLSGAPFCGVPADYKWQMVNYFLVNQDLEKLHFAVYDARIINTDAKLFTVEVYRNDPRMLDAIAEAWQELEAFRRDWIEWRDIVLPSEI